VGARLYKWIIVHSVVRRRLVARENGYKAKRVRASIYKSVRKSGRYASDVGSFGSEPLVAQHIIRRAFDKNVSLLTVMSM
jgi:hypothetical protein